MYYAIGHLKEAMNHYCADLEISTRLITAEPLNREKRRDLCIAMYKLDLSSYRWRRRQSLPVLDARAEDSSEMTNIGIP